MHFRNWLQMRYKSMVAAVSIRFYCLVIGKYIRIVATPPGKTDAPVLSSVEYACKLQVTSRGKFVPGRRNDGADQSRWQVTSTTTSGSHPPRASRERATTDRGWTSSTSVKWTMKDKLLASSLDLQVEGKRLDGKTDQCVTRREQISAWHDRDKEQ